MLKAMSQCIDITRKTFYRHGYKAGRELVCSGLTYKIGRLFMWLPVKIKNLLHRG